MNNKIKMKYKDLLIADPGYIRSVRCMDEDRYDGLKCVMTLHEGDDGYYEIFSGDTSLGEVGVDSGRIWVMQAEFDIEVDIDSGLSGEIYIDSDREDTQQLLSRINYC